MSSPSELKSDLWGNLSCSDLMKCRSQLTKWQACLRHQKKGSVPPGMLSREVCLCPEEGRKQTHQTSSTIPGPGRPRVPLRIMYKRGMTYTLGVIDLWGLWSSTTLTQTGSDEGYKGTPAQPSLALGRLRVTPFPFCLVASPATVLLGQLVGDHKELNKKSTRRACWQLTS